MGNSQRKRPQPSRDDGEDEEVMAESDRLPTNRIAMAKAVVATLNQGFEREEKGEEEKTEVLMEVTPQNLTTQPKIQTEALMTPKGKSKPKTREPSKGSKDVLTTSKFDLEIPKEILKSAPSQPDGVYSALEKRMAEDG